MNIFPAARPAPSLVPRHYLTSFIGGIVWQDEILILRLLRQATRNRNVWE